MELALFSRLPFGSRKGKTTSGGAGGKPTQFRPAVEGLEDRVTPATMNLPLAVSALNVVGTGADRSLNAVLSLGGQEVGSAPIAVTTSAPVQAAQAAEECPILNLHLGPIDLNLLGLQVDTSEICLDVTATNHQGLLGGLLCDLSGGGLNLGGILTQLGNQATTFLNDLDRLLDNVLGRQMNVTEVFGQPVSGPGGITTHQAGVCDILNLELGPVELRVPLLGVNVFLDNCADPPGPITVDVTANPEGGILGSLLCGIADGINLNGLNLNRLIRQVDRLIDGLTDLAGSLGRLGDRLDQLVDRLDRLIDRLGDLNKVEKVVDQLEKIVDRLDNLIDRLDEIPRLDRLVGQLDRLVDRLGDLIDRLT